MNYNEEIKKRGLKKKWVADKIGIHQVLLSYYTNNVRPMPEEVEMKLKQLLGS